MKNIHIVMFILFSLLSVKKARGCNRFLQGYDQFARTRLDEYRKAYNPQSVPLDKHIYKSLAEIAWAKAYNVPKKPDEYAPNCPYSPYYQFIINSTYTCCGDACGSFFLRYSNYSTDLTNFQFVVNKRVCFDQNNPDTHVLLTMEEDIDTLMTLPKAKEVIVGRPNSNIWAMHSSDYFESCHIVFATADDSGDYSKPSPMCDYEDEDPTWIIASKKPIPNVKNKVDVLPLPDIVKKIINGALLNKSKPPDFLWRWGPE